MDIICVNQKIVNTINFFASRVSESKTTISLAVMKIIRQTSVFFFMEPLVPPSILESVRHYLELLDHWNARHALTALSAEHRFEELIQDACALLPHLQGVPAGTRLVDFGTGMGIPALVLALARPDLEIHAVDKSKKKIAFVRQASLELSLTNLIAVSGRCEELPPIMADLGTAKAVGGLDLLLGWWMRHGRPGAPLLLLKGEDTASEPCPSGWSLETHPYQLPTRGKRLVLSIKKEPVQ